MYGRSRGNWKVGEKGHTVVTDDGFGFRPNTGHDEVSWYGGYLIAESILKKEDALVIAAATDLLDAGKQIVYGVEMIDRDEFLKGLDNMRKAIKKAEPGQKLLDK